MNRGSKRKMFRRAERARAEYEAEDRPRGPLDDIVSIMITTTTSPKVDITREGYAVPVVISQEALPRDRNRVKIYRHWTALYLSGFGTERQQARARQWLKRRARRRRKAARGWA